MAYRQTEAEKAKRREYAKTYRQRPEAKARDAQRARGRRAAPGGAELNLMRVEANRAALGRGYMTQLLTDESGIARRVMPDDLVELKRHQILLKRLASELRKAAIQTKE